MDFLVASVDFLILTGSPCLYIWQVRIILFLWAFMLFPFQGFNQYYSGERTKVEWNGDFEFLEGIYLVINDFRANDPLPADSVLSDFNSEEEDFLKNVLEQKELVYSYNLHINRILTDKVWGYCSNGNVYIQIQGSFHRIMTIGSLCQFVATITTYVPVNNNGFYPGTPYMGGVTYVPSTEIKKMLLDYNTGKTVEFTTDNLEEYLQRIPGLAKEFSALSQKKKKEMLHSFLNRYNEAFPLFIPE